LGYILIQYYVTSFWGGPFLPDIPIWMNWHLLPVLTVTKLTTYGNREEKYTINICHWECPRASSCRKLTLVINETKIPKKTLHQGRKSDNKFLWNRRNAINLFYRHIILYFHTSPPKKKEEKINFFHFHTLSFHHHLIHAKC